MLGVLLGDTASSRNGSQDGMPGDVSGPWGTDGTGASRDGAMVQDVVPDGPAAQAGLAAGDLITAVDAQSITTADGLSDLLEAHDVGDRIAVRWSDSSGTDHTATLTLAASPIA